MRVLRAYGCRGVSRPRGLPTRRELSGSCPALSWLRTLLIRQGSSLQPPLVWTLEMVVVVCDLSMFELADKHREWQC